jgi:hypothetical protein
MDIPTYLVTPASKVSPGVDGHPHHLVTPASKVSPGCQWTSPPTLSHQPAKYRQVSIDIPTWVLRASVYTAPESVK